MSISPITVGLVIGTSSTADAVCNCLRARSVRIVFDHRSKIGYSELAEEISQTRPDLLILDVCAVDPMAETFASIRSSPDAPAVAALHTSASPDLILDAVRAGASDFLYPPFETTIPAALARISEARRTETEPSRKRGRVIGFMGAKGGCGTTTIACHMAVELPRQTGHTALLADLDFDTGLIAFVMKTKSEYTISDAVRNLHRLDLSFWNKIVSNGHQGLHVITAPSEHCHTVDADALSAVVSFARRAYDWVLLDLGRGLYPSRTSAFALVDELFVITTMEITSLHLARTIAQKLADQGISGEVLRILVNRFGLPDDPDLTLRELGRALGHEIFGTVANDYPSLQDSYTQGRLLGEETRVRRQVAAIARRVAGLPDEKPKRRFSLFR